MKSIYNFLKLANREPLGCLISTVLSVALISAMLAGAIYVTYLMFSVSLIKGVITSSTGFATSAQNIYINIFTGNCEIDGMSLANPSVYEIDSRLAKRPENIDKFLHAKKINIELNPFELLRGNLVISSIYADITFLNCVRINDSTYNLIEFLNGMKKSVTVKKEDGKPFLKNITMKISRAAYSDYVTGLNNISWSASDISFQKSNVVNMSKLIADMKECFESSNARFISTALDAIETEKH